MDSTWFFHPEAERGPNRAHREANAKAICSRCPVITACRAHALSVHEPTGSGGGLTENERTQILTDVLSRDLTVWHSLVVPFARWRSQISTSTDPTPNADDSVLNVPGIAVRKAGAGLPPVDGHHLVGISAAHTLQGVTADSVQTHPSSDRSPDNHTSPTLSLVRAIR